MFPNIRLMIVTVLAAILGIGCGLGLFATFRVNHEPLALARLSNGGVPLQLAWEKAEPAPKPSPWGVGYPVNGEAKPIAARVLPSQPAPADMHATEPALAAAATAASDRTSGETAVPIASKAESKPEGAVVAAADSPDPPVPAPEPRPAAAEIAPDAETTPTAEAASTPQTAPVPEAAPAAETAPIDATAPAAQITPAAEAAPASETADPETASAASTAPAAGAAPTADTASAAESAPAAQNGPAAEAAPAMEAPQGASAAPASGEEGKPVQNETTAALNSQTPATQKPAAQGASANSPGDRKAATKDVVKQQEVKAARPAPPVLRRVTKVLGWHRPQTAIASQSTGLFSQLVSEPAYRWTDTAAQPPPTVRRVVIRQRRVIMKKPASQPSRQSSRTNQG